MFLRKIFSTKNRFVWVIIDLIIVITGVYCAFLFQNYAENQKNLKEQDKVLTALKYELEKFRITMPGMSGYMRSKQSEWKQAYDSGNYISFSGYRYIAPQYKYQIVEYALNNQNSEIVDFELHDALQVLYVEIKKLEHTEELIMNKSVQYRSIPSGLKKSSEKLWAQNYDNFAWMVIFLGDRSSILNRVAEASEEALITINERLSTQRRKEIERAIMVGLIDRVEDEDDAVKSAKKIFPLFTETEIREIHRESRSGNGP